MITIARDVEGISLNGLEWLLDEKGDTMKFQTKKDAMRYLRENGYKDFSDEELEDNFIFDEENE